MILKTPMQFMNLVGMDIIPVADENTEEKWRELFGTTPNTRQQGSSKEDFDKNKDDHTSMPTIIPHAMLSQHACGGAPSKADKSRLNPFLWTRQALQFVTYKHKTSLRKYPIKSPIQRPNMVDRP